MAKQPEWLKNAIFYEIYPQSFMDSNGDGIGDFQGIISKLDYIKELGCNALWINPCFDSPFGDAGYDVADYKKAAPRYGTNDDLKQLFSEAHKKGIHVLLDLVPGHTSTEHPWFKESMKAEKNEYTDRYIWTDSIWIEPKGYGSLRGISDRDGSCVVNFFSHQPALNYGFYKPNESWQQSFDDPGPQASLAAMKEVMAFWLDAGCDGFRVDMAGAMVKNDENGKGTIRLWQNVREYLDKNYPDAAMVSEWGEPDKSLQGGFHMDFLLHFGPSHYNDLFRCEEPYFSSRGKGEIKEFVKKYLENYEKSERKGLICIPSGNHDMDRLARSLSQEEMKIAFAFLLTMPGAPFIYYGDEIGMNYVEGLVSKEGGYSRTGSRTPMQWDFSKNAGFSTGDEKSLYLPQDSSKHRPTAKAQMEQDCSLWKEVQKLINLRLSTPDLLNCEEIKFIKIRYPLIYKRGQRTIVILNPSEKPCSYKSKEGKVIYTVGNGVSYKNGKYQISGCTAAVIQL